MTSLFKVKLTNAQKLVNEAMTMKARQAQDFLKMAGFSTKEITALRN